MSKKLKKIEKNFEKILNFFFFFLSFDLYIDVEKLSVVVVSGGGWVHLDFCIRMVLF